MVAVSQAPSPESNPDSPSPVVTMVGTALPSKVDRADVRMGRRRHGGRAIGPRLQLRRFMGKFRIKAQTGLMLTKRRSPTWVAVQANATRAYQKPNDSLTFMSHFRIIHHHQLLSITLQGFSTSAKAGILSLGIVVLAYAF